VIAINEKKFKNRETLLKAALYEFCKYNYEAASLNRIIKESGSSKGSFYYHFENKENLYIQLLQMSVEAKWHYINQYTKDHKMDFEKMDIFNKLLFQAEIGISFGDVYPKYNLLGEMFNKEKGSDIYNKVIKQLSIDTEDILPSMIEEAYELGQLNAYYSKEFITSLVTYLFSSFNDIFSETQDVKDKLEKLKNYVHFMRCGLS
jgi:AcrR family transcriptional regulator